MTIAKFHNIPVHKTQAVFDTTGTGFWSKAKKKVKVTGISVSNINGCYGEMSVYFDVKGWDVNELGLIYSDLGFLQDLRDGLKEAGYDNVQDINYSEQGMQGDDYVSLDVGPRFLKNFA